MILSVNSMSLGNGLETIKAVISSNKILPVCNNVKLETKGDVITLTGDNTSHTIVTNVPCNCEEGFSSLIPFQDLYNLVIGIPSCDLEITFKDKQVSIHTERGTYVIDEVDDVIYFPRTMFIDQPLNTAVLQSSYIGQIHDKSIKFCHPDPGYINMNDVCFDFTGEELNVVATNIVSISKFSIPCPLTGKGRYLIQKKAMDLMTVFAFTGEVWFKFSDSKVQIENQDTVLISPLVDQNFPDYSGVFLKEFNTVEAPRKELLKSLNRASKFASVNNAGIIVGDHSIKIIAHNDLAGKTFDETVTLVDCQLEQQIKVGIVINQIADALGACNTDTVIIGFANEKKPIVIKESGSDNFIFQVSPLVFNYK
jgi:DNA polymerase III sliding clamp (beta) subunit (PCNA family)